MTRCAIALLATVLLLSACESDEAKLRRLEVEKTVACLSAERLSEEVETLRNSAQSLDELSAEVNARERGDSALADSLDAVSRQKMKAAGYDTLSAQWLDADSRCKLATREYNRFMR